MLNAWPSTSNASISPSHCRGDVRLPPLRPADSIRLGQPLCAEAAMSHPTRMSAADTGLLIIDVQEKLIPKIHAAETVVRNAAFLIDAARALAMPVQATEQSPKGLGAT